MTSAWEQPEFEPEAEINRRIDKIKTHISKNIVFLQNEIQGLQSTFSQRTLLKGNILFSNIFFIKRAEIKCHLLITYSSHFLFTSLATFLWQVST